MSEIVLSVSKVGKRYAAYASNLLRFASWFGIPVKPASEYWAVRDISFDLRAGEALALIGQNGAGKSTLLKMITGTVRPATGAVGVNGRISAILELGLGFNPEFTGRQNVYQAGGLMGFSHEELTRLMPEIEAFAEIGEFFDQPLRVYSSGMQARLAFALATCKRPEVLIIDEVLSVGDSYFQHKSFDRIRRFKEQGTSILFVSHSMGDVRALCERVLLLDKGAVLKDGPPDEVVDYYNALIAEKENAKLSIEQRRLKGGWVASEYGSMEVIAEQVQLLDAVSLEPVSTVAVGQSLVLETRAKVISNIPRLILGHRLTDRSGHIVWGTNTWHTNQSIVDVKSGEIITFRLFFECSLGPGSYAWSFGLVSSDTHLENCYHKFDNKVIFDVINADRHYFAGTNALKTTISIDRNIDVRAVRIAIVSTPRSGNTWLRKLLSNIYSANEYAVHAPHEFEWGDILPDSKIVLQLHWLPDDEFVGRLKNHGFIIVTLARHPLDIMLSILQFSPKEPQTARWLEGAGGGEEWIHGRGPESDEFLSYATGPRAKALLSVSYEWSKRDDVFLVRYEELVHDAVRALEDLVQKIGLPYLTDNEAIKEAVRQTRFSELQKTSSNGHFWQGTPGIWQQFFGAQRAISIKNAHFEIFEHFGYDVNEATICADDVIRVRWKEVCQ